jgi:hypothetical protein
MVICGVRRAYADVSFRFLVDCDTDQEAKDQILAGVNTEIPAHYSPELKNVVRSMLAQDVSPCLSDA